MQEFHKDLLDAHNECRVEHAAQDLIWSDDLANEAQTWVDQIAKEGKLRHASLEQRKGHGENIAMAGQYLTTQQK